MKEHTKIFIIFSLLLFIIIVGKLYKESDNNEQLKNMIIKDESKSLAALVISFRQTYQDAFTKYHIPVDDKTVNLLPVRTTKDIGDAFSKIVGDRVTIKTVSDKPRNLLNKANEQELEIIDYFSKNPEQDSYFSIDNDGLFHYAQPLYINQICLKCHGKKEDAVQIIKNNYDTAYDYKLGDLRGILSISMSKQNIIEKIDDNYKASMQIAMVVYILFLLTIYFMIQIIVKNKNRYAKTLEEKVQEEVEYSRQKDEMLYKSEKMASMGEMIGNIAHQWRQPLSAISTVATGTKFQKEFGKIDDEELLKNMDIINEHAQYLSETINDFRNFIKGDRTLEVFSLKNDTDSFLHLVDGSIKSHHINVILDLEESIQVKGYPNELIQCFINIFNNAKDALLEVDEEDRLIFISSKMTQEQIIIKFRDSAGGIPEDVLPKIFDPYFTTKHKSQGTGLGLHMTYKLIVEGMNGIVEAQNLTYEYNGKTYKGAEFTIIFPIAK